MVIDKNNIQNIYLHNIYNVLKHSVVLDILSEEPMLVSKISIEEHPYD